MSDPFAPAISVAEALAAFRTANGVPANAATARRWYFDLGPIRIERHDRAQLFGHQRHQSARPPLASMI